MSLRDLLRKYRRIKTAAWVVLGAFLAGLVGGAELTSGLESLLEIPEGSDFSVALKGTLPLVTGVVSAVMAIVCFALFFGSFRDEPGPHRAFACDQCGSTTKHGWCEACQTWIDTEEFDADESEYCERCHLPLLDGWCDRCGSWSASKVDDSAS